MAVHAGALAERPRGLGALVSARRSAGSAEAGAALRGVRHARGLTARAVADRMGISPDGYRAYEKGYVQVRLENVPRLARALEMTPLALAKALGLPTEAFEPPDESWAARIVDVLGPKNAQYVPQLVDRLKDFTPDEQQQLLETLADLVQIQAERAAARKRRTES